MSSAINAVIMKPVNLETELHIRHFLISSEWQKQSNIRFHLLEKNTVASRLLLGYFTDGLLCLNVIAQTL